MLLKIRQKIKNDLLLSVGFMILFAANNTQIRIQKLITLSIQNDIPEYSADGYVIYGIKFSVQSIAVWLSPAIVHYCGLRNSMLIGALGSIPLATFFCFENTMLTYLSAVITGYTNGILWCAQAVYTVMNSDVGSVYTSIAIFTLIFQFSSVLGSGVLYFQFGDSARLLDRVMRMKIAFVLLSFCVSATVILYFLSPATRDNPQQKDIPNCRILLNRVKMAFTVMATKKMSVACIIFGYIGANVTYMNVVGTSIGFSKFLSSNSKIYSPISGIVQGAGEMFGSASAFYLKDKRLFSRAPILMIGCLAGALALNVIFLGLPDTSVFSYTDEFPTIQFPVFILMLANFLIGFTDAALQIEVYNYIGTLYPDNSAPAFAVFKFTRYVAVAVSFYYGNLFGLHIQTLILCVMNVLSLGAYYYSTTKPRIAPDEKYSISNSSASKQSEHVSKVEP